MGTLRMRFLGAAGEVTGSATLVETPDARVLVDFGLFQGHRDVEEINGLPPELEPARLDAVVITHGHLDHVGRLPLLSRNGFAGPVYCTQATGEIITGKLAGASPWPRSFAGAGGFSRTCPFTVR